MIKVKKGYYFKYTLSYKTISNRSSEKKYIRTFKSLNHTYLTYLNPFSFKVHEMGAIKY
jgi:hypothetical protein